MAQSSVEREILELKMRVDTMEEVLQGIRNEVVVALHRDSLDVVYLRRALGNIRAELMKLPGPHG